jgi:sulfite reductase beta subunit-like hemoprotein
MEKETKRALQGMLEILREQQDTIHALQGRVSPPSQRAADGLADRIGRITTELSNRQAFEIDWARLCDRHYAAPS